MLLKDLERPITFVEINNCGWSECVSTNLESGETVSKDKVKENINRWWGTL